MIDSSFWWGAGIGAGISALAGFLLWRNWRSPELEVAEAGPVLTAPRAPPDPEPPWSEREPQPAAFPDGPASTGGPAPPAQLDPNLRTAYRVLLHLYRSRDPGETGVAPAEFSPAGMGAALGIPEGSITAALRRLCEAGLVSVELARVTGHNRRVKAYRLTAVGEELVRVIRNSRNPVHCYDSPRGLPSAVDASGAQPARR